jgi:hypothetical protein
MAHKCINIILEKIREQNLNRQLSGVLLGRPVDDLADLTHLGLPSYTPVANRTAWRKGETRRVVIRHRPLNLLVIKISIYRP